MWCGEFGNCLEGGRVWVLRGVTQPPGFSFIGGVPLNPQKGVEWDPSLEWPPHDSAVIAQFPIGSLSVFTNW